MDWFLGMYISSTKKAFDPSEPISNLVEPMPLNQMFALPAPSPETNMSGTIVVRSSVSLNPAPSSMLPEKA